MIRTIVQDANSKTAIGSEGRVAFPLKTSDKDVVKGYAKKFGRVNVSGSAEGPGTALQVAELDKIIVGLTEDKEALSAAVEGLGGTLDATKAELDAALETVARLEKELAIKNDPVEAALKKAQTPAKK